MSISVVVPAYNEAEHIKNTLVSIHDFLSKGQDDFEIITVDDGSIDETAKTVEELSKELGNIKLIKNEHRGKGYSVKTGVLAASKDIVLFSDADLSTPIEELEGFIKYLDEGYDVVIGSRALKESNLIKKQGFLRRTMGKVFNLFIRMFLFGGINDTQCGFKAFKGSVAKELFSLQRLDGFCFDAEILYIARRKGYSIKEAGVRWINREHSKVSIVSSPINMFFDIFLIRINGIRGVYENQ
jgi:dolichyl-phosphate beta-glucosyltransferase